MYVAAKMCEEVVDLANERVRIIQKYKEDVKREENKKCSLQYLKCFFILLKIRESLEKA